jgi:hypothetical protein
MTPRRTRPKVRYLVTREDGRVVVAFLTQAAAIRWARGQKQYGLIVVTRTGTRRRLRRPGVKSYGDLIVNRRRGYVTERRTPGKVNR